MGFAKGSTAAPAAEQMPGTPAPDAYQKAAEPVTRRSPVQGQVAMHAIITGYKVASQLAATIAASPEAVKTKLHEIAAEVAAKIEEYTFKGE